MPSMTEQGAAPYVLTDDAKAYFQGLSGKLKSFGAPKASNSQIGVSAQQATANNGEVITVLESLRTDFPDSYSRKAIQHKWEGWASKELDTIDLTSLTAASISPRIAKMRNTETKFKNLLDSQPGPKPRILDWLYRIREERIGLQYAPAFNPDGLLPPVDQSLYSQRFNALMFIGETLQQSIVASDMTNMQADLALMAEEVDMCLVRIMKGENRFLLRGQIQTSFAPTNIPQCNGFQTTSDMNSIDLGGTDLTHDYISLAQATICAYFGYDVQLAMLVNPRQVQVLDNLETQYYPGNTGPTQMMFAETLVNRLQTGKVPIDLVYRPKQGGLPIPVIRELDMLPNTALLFIVTFPMEAEFMLGGQPGPHALVRYTERLINMVVVFKGFTGDFPLPESRIEFTGVAA